MVLSRKLTSGKIAIASFLVDVWHKGIADCVYAELSEPEFNAAVKDWQNAKLPLERTEAAYVKKVILGAVAFAQTEEHQHQPHPDYAIVAQILEQDIDVTACSTEFVFGKEATLKHRRTPLIIKLKEDLRTAGVM
ncbi:MAG: hypothetical protein COC15_03925 [Legionellales bacterium]|nr:MAG: hypothetical protein COC15_03925 [Legionellales bacterium]